MVGTAVRQDLLNLRGSLPEELISCAVARIMEFFEFTQNTASAELEFNRGDQVFTFRFDPSQMYIVIQITNVNGQTSFSLCDNKMLIQNGTSFQFREEGARDFYKEFTLKMANFYKPFMQLPGGGMASPAYSSSSEDSDRQ